MYLVRRKTGSWEIRESRSTPRGPRSRTLATFSVLTPEVIEHARSRAERLIDPDDFRAAALRAGAPVASASPDRAARELLAELAAGHPPRPALARVLGDLLKTDSAPSSDAARSAAAWVGASAVERGEALRDLLLLTDKLPPASRRGGLRFPPLKSAAA